LAAKGQLSNEMLSIFGSVQHQGWPFLLTLGESWFFSSTDYEIIWRGKAKHLQKRKTTNPGKNDGRHNRMQSIGGHGVDALPRELHERFA
jgi:hypothetical protein